MKKLLIIIMFILLSTSVLGFSHNKIDINRTIVLNKSYESNKYVLGNTVDILKSVGGDLVGVAQQIYVGSVIDDDLNFVAKTVVMNGTVGGDLRLIAGNVYVDGTIFKEVLVFGQEVRFTNETDVGNDAAIYGDSLNIEGKYDKDLILKGNYVYFNGVVLGDFTLQASKFKLGPDARVSGNLRVNDDLKFNDSFVQGKIIRVPYNDASSDFLKSHMNFSNSLLMVISILILGLILLLIFKSKSKQISITAIQRPLYSFILGFVSLIVVPLLAFGLLFTVVGVPLGVLLMLTYLSLLIVVMPLTAVYIGDLFLRFFNLEEYTYLKLLVGSIVFVLIMWISVFGVLILLIANILVFGAIIRNFYGKDKLKRKKKRSKRTIVKKTSLKKNSFKETKSSKKVNSFKKMNKRKKPNKRK